MKKFCILSLDGGGIKGLSQAIILNYIEKELKKRVKNSNLIDFFDLISGTSIGGVQALFLLVSENGKSLYSTYDLIQLFLNRGKDIFEIPLIHKVKSLFGLSDEKYPAKNLEKILKDYLKNYTLRDLQKYCLIPSYNITKGKNVFFTSYKLRKTNGDKIFFDSEKCDIFLRNIGRATSAAPTYFEPYEHFNNDLYIDGGLFANNPCLCAYVESRKINNSLTANNMFILSLGCGSKNIKLEHKIKNWGIASWVKPLIDILLTAPAEVTDIQLREIFKSISKEEQYIRLNIDYKTASNDLDNVTEENIGNLYNDSINYVSENKEQLNKIVDFLIRNKQ